MNPKKFEGKDNYFNSLMRVLECQSFFYELQKRNQTSIFDF